MKHKAKATSSSSPNKGKGKGSQGKGKEKTEKAGGAEAIDLKDCPLRLVEFASSEHNKLVPRYSSVQRRSEQDGIGLEDVDPLQVELEALLSATAVRKMTLKEEVKILSNLERYKGQGKAHKRGPSSPGKRGLTKDGRSVKKFKPSSGKPIDSVKVIGVPKLKSSDGNSGAPAFDPLQNEQIRPVQETSKPSAPKNETPNRFWAFVEPYCAPICSDDIKLLEDLIRTHGDMSEYYRVPKLGQHYTVRWANEDLEYERTKSSAASNAAPASVGGDHESNEAGIEKVLLKQREAAAEKVSYGDLTQRLVAGLIEDNLMTSVEDSIDRKSSSADENNDGGDKSQLMKSLNVGNADALEARVKKELQDHGILDPEDEEDEGIESEERDEIYDELVRCQSELSAVSAHNLQQLRRLAKAAKEEISRQETRNKLAAADQDVMEAYKKIAAARSKKKPPSKKEREQAWKSLKEREIILKQLEEGS